MVKSESPWLFAEEFESEGKTEHKDRTCTPSPCTPVPLMDHTAVLWSHDSGTSNTCNTVRGGGCRIDLALPPRVSQGEGLRSNWSLQSWSEDSRGATTEMAALTIVSFQASICNQQGEKSNEKLPCVCFLSPFYESRAGLTADHPSQCKQHKYRRTLLLIINA